MVAKSKEKAEMRSFLSLIELEKAMSKTKSGFTLVGGLLTALISAGSLWLIQQNPDTPVEWDSAILCLRIGFGVAALVGIVFFFVGSLHFARGE